MIINESLQLMNLRLSLFLLRIGVFIVMLAWTLDKILNPAHAINIFEELYFLKGLSNNLMIAVGIIELIIILVFLAGLFKKYTYGFIIIIHAISTIAPWQKYTIELGATYSMLYYADWPMLAACITLYVLRDLDTKYTVGHQYENIGNQEPLMIANVISENRERFEMCLFLLRLGVFIVMFVWTMGKFFDPDHVIRYFNRFFLIGGLVKPIVYTLGIIETLIIIAFLGGLWKRYTYGIVLFLHSVSTFMTWKKYTIDIHLLFFTAWPMLAACIALYLLRDLDVKFTFNKEFTK